MSRKPNVEEIVSALVGTWVGGGQGGYPTIDSFEYREVLTISDRSDRPELHYDQRTWRLEPEGEVVSHWETGFLRLSSDGSARLSNSQGGRVEMMEGTWGRDSDRWTIDLESVGYAGDKRVVNSTRQLQVTDGGLRYSMSMETVRTGASHPHLSATLSRKPSLGAK